MATANMAGLPDIIFGGQGQLPVDFNRIPPRIAHGVIATLLALITAFARAGGDLSPLYS